MPKRTDIHRILLLGSGPIRIGQAAEFDFSGSQACRGAAVTYPWSGARPEALGWPRLWPRAADGALHLGRSKCRQPPRLRALRWREGEPASGGTARGDVSSPLAPAAPSERALLALGK